MHCNLTHVRDLMEEGGQKWDQWTVKHIFSPQEANKILQIPISLLDSEDRLIWNFTKHGQYTAQSGYDLASRFHRARQDKPESSNIGEENRRKWSALWKLKIKRKIKSFLWKCNLDALPVKMALKKRHMSVDPTCPVCGDQEETLEHLFFFCERAKRIWAISPVQWDDLNKFSTDFKQWWIMLSKLPLVQEIHNRIELTSYLLWHMWKTRNEICFNNNHTPEIEVIHRASVEWNEFLQASESKLPTSRSQLSRNPKDHNIAPPDVLTSRNRHQPQNPSNSSAATTNVLTISSVKKANSQAFATGFSLSDIHGSSILTEVVVRDPDHSPVAATLIALRVALMEAHRRNWAALQVKIDNCSVVQILSKKSAKDIELQTLLDDISFLQNCFSAL